MAVESNFSIWRSSVCLPKFDDAMNLSETLSNSDPEDEPFKSKYEARELWKQLEDDLKERERTLDDTERSEALGMHPALKYVLGCNYVEAEEVGTGEEKLVFALQAVEAEKMNPRYCGLTVKVLNMLGILWSGREDYEKALQYLKNSEQLYKEYSSAVEVAPFTIRDLFVGKGHWTPEDGRHAEFESDHTHTLFYLAQVYSKLQMEKESAEFCYMTLKRQLETKQFDHAEWSLNCATLAQYYLSVGDYMSTRHCLACASKIASQCVVQEDQPEKLLKCKADISRCWVKYCLQILEDSKSKVEMAVRTGDEPETEPATELTHEIPLFDLDVSEFESNIGVSYVVTFEAARHVFLFGQQHVDLARQFFVLDSYCTDYVSITQDYSQLFKKLGFFEIDFDRQCRMHKRRADMLQDTLKQLNPQFYLMICRQLMFEIAEIYNTMVELKYSIAEQKPGPPTPHMIKKINQLVQQSIDQFQVFIDSFRDHRKEMPKTFDSDSLRPVLTAKFCVARLYTKFVVSEVHRRVENMKKALDLYQELIHYRDAHPDMPAVFTEELAICEEMVQLMPIKMSRIMQNP